MVSTFHSEHFSRLQNLHTGAKQTFKHFSSSPTIHRLKSVDPVQYHGGTSHRRLGWTVLQQAHTLEEKAPFSDQNNQNFRTNSQPRLDIILWVFFWIAFPDSYLFTVPQQNSLLSTFSFVIQSILLLTAASFDISEQSFSGIAVFPVVSLVLYRICHKLLACICGVENTILQGAPI